MRLRIRSTLARWSLAPLSVALAVAARVLFRQVLEGVPPIPLFFAPVMVSAAFGGLGPGLLALGLSVAAINFFLMAPFDAFVWPDRVQFIQLLLFVLEGVLLSVLSWVLHDAVRRARASERATQVLERRVLEVADAERRRIGHDLHDALGQQLLGAAFMGKTLQKRLADADPHLAPVAGEIVTEINGALSFTRDLARSLSSFTPSLDDFPAAMADLAVTTEKMFGVRCSFHRDVHVLPPAGDVAEHLYRLAQEAISNAVKHGKSTQIDIVWTTHKGRQVLRIRDDGRGLKPPGGPDAVGPRGIGLHVMRSRAELIAGTLSVRNGETGGTVVECEVGAQARANPRAQDGAGVAAPVPAPPPVPFAASVAAEPRSTP